MEEFPKRLKAIRKEFGLNQEEVAADTGSMNRERATRTCLACMRWRSISMSASTTSWAGLTNGKLTGEGGVGTHHDASEKRPGERITADEP